MKQTFAFFFGVLTSKLRAYGAAWRDADAASSPGVRAVYAVLVAFLTAALSLLHTPRTYQGVGYLPAPLWTVPLIGLVACALLLPVATRFVPTPGLWRTAPLLLVLVPWLPETVQIGVSFIGGAGLLCWLKGSGIRRISGLFAELSGLWLLCLLISNAYQYVLTRITDWSFLANLALPFVRLLGWEAGSEGSRLHMAHEGVTATALVSPDKFGGEFAFVFLAGLLLMGLAHRLPLRRLALAAGLASGYTLCYGIFVITSNVVEGSTIPWWNEARLSSAFIPLSLLLIMVLGRAELPGSTTSRVAATPAPPAAPLIGTPRRRATRLVLATAGAFAVTLGWLWVDPGTKKHGKVLIDEKYSRWEWSEAPLDTKLYGVKTVYSYYNMIEALKHYYSVDRNFQEISDATLQDVSVLILKTPTIAYSSGALGAIHRFVARGGGVWLIGDHTDIFGMDTYLNSVAAPYGVQFEANAAVDVDQNRQLYKPIRTTHPIARRMPLFLWYTSDALHPSWTSRDVISTPRLLVDNADYSSNTFFGNFHPDLDESVGPVAQAVAVESGKGRVALWSDSTLFSNFSIFLPGKMELVLGNIDWLNRVNSSLPIRFVLLGAGAGLLLVGFVRRQQSAVLPLGLWAGLALALVAANGIYERSYPELTPNQPFETVAFLEPDVNSHVPVSRAMDEPELDTYLTAFIAAQRAGKHTMVAPSVEKALPAQTIVLVHSHNRLSNDDVATLHAWVRRGGHLILLDAANTGDGNSRQTLEQLVAPTALRLRATPEPAPVSPLPNIPLPAVPVAIPSEEAHARPVMDRNGIGLGPEPIFATITGGTPLLLANNEVIGAQAGLGSGKITVTTTQGLFSDLSLGAESTVPNDRQLVLMHWLYAWYRGEENASTSHQIASGLALLQRR